MDHYEARSWPAWGRHILFTFIAQLFISKLRAMHGVTVGTPGPAPVMDAPVPLGEYRQAAIEAQHNREITHPRIRACPRGPQQVLTIGLVRDLIQPFLVKIGKVVDTVDHKLMGMYDAFFHHSAVKIAEVLASDTG
jgi:hypothetical protein